MKQEDSNSNREQAGVKLASSKADFTINARAVSATTIIGSLVIDKSGKRLGKIEEIVLDLTDGTVSYLVLAVGGIFGIGDRFFAVPLNALSLDLKSSTFQIDIGKNEFKRLRGFDKEHWPKQADWPPGNQ